MAATGIEQLLLQVFVIFTAAKLLGLLVERLGGPSVVGEISAGIVLGLPFFASLDLASGAEVLEFLAEVGVVFLLFAVGLETPLHQLRQVGRTAMGVAVAGVVVPLAEGIGLGMWMGEGTAESIFLGVALVATSVGITAKVLADKGLLDSQVARVILGAAVIDDVLGLLVLAIAKGIAVGGGVNFLEFAYVAALAVVFVLAVMFLGPRMVRVAVRRVERRDRAFEKTRNLVISLAVAVCLGFSALAGVMGLAALVGAFFAGMAFAEFREKFQLEHGIQPLVLLTTPLFFAFIGLQLDLGAAQSVLGLIVLVTVVAILTKLVPCALAAWRMGRWSALAVGAGMAPRGEVGIVVALVGLNAGVVGPDLYAVVVAMALLTTLLGPPLLDVMLKRVPRTEPHPERVVTEMS